MFAARIRHVLADASFVPIHIGCRSTDLHALRSEDSTEHSAAAKTPDDVQENGCRVTKYGGSRISRMPLLSYSPERENGDDKRGQILLRLLVSCVMFMPSYYIRHFIVSHRKFALIVRPECSRVQISGFS